MYNRPFGLQLVNLWRSEPGTQLVQPETRIDEANTRERQDHDPPDADTAVRNLDDTTEIISVRDMLCLCLPGDPARPLSLESLAVLLTSRYQRLGGIDDLDEAIVLSREALSLRPLGHPHRSSSLNNLAAHLSSRYEQLGGMNDLNEGIVLNREVLSLHPPGHPRRSSSLNNLVNNLSDRFQQLGEIDDLKEAIVLSREALSLCPPGHPDRSLSLSNLGSQLSDRFQQLGETDDLKEAIALSREALSLCPPGHPRRSMSLNNLGNQLSYRFLQLGGMDDLREAIVLGSEALSLFPPGHPHLSASLNNLASYLSYRYEQLGGMDDLKVAIVLSREALSLRPPGHPHRSSSLNNLGSQLSIRFQQLGGIDDLNEAIEFNCEALSLCPPGHPNRSLSLNNLVTQLSIRFQQLGGIDDLNEAIELNREAVSLCPPGHPGRSMSLGNLGNRLSTRYEQIGGIDNLNEAIVLGREALSLCPPGHPGRSSALNNLGNHLSSRYKQLRGIDDLNEAIELNREALSLCPLGHPGRSMSLGNLGNRLSSRHEGLRHIDDLNEAIVLGREALLLHPLGHLDRARSLNSLGNQLSRRFLQLGGINDLEEAIALGREALSLHPPGHHGRSGSLNILGNNLFYRFQQLGEIDDLNQAFALDREALSLHPFGHPDRSASLNNLAIHMSSWYNHPRGVDDAVEDRQALFALFSELEHVSQTVSTNDIVASRKWVETAEEFHHPTTLSAYETALRLLVEHSSTLPPLPQHFAHLKSLSSSLAVDAFSACLRSEFLASAVELLEQGRGVFWSQLTRLRSPLDEVVASGPEAKVLADEFMRLTSLIRMTLRSPAPDQHDRVWRLNSELKKVVSNIRELPSLSRFLLPSLFSDLQSAARDGPVIIVNASKYGCDALVVFIDRDPVHIPLPVTKEEVRGLSDVFHTLGVHARMKVTTNFQAILRELWDKVVSPIVDVLRSTCPHHSHIWWCPTAEFSLLPLHAAAPYRKDQECVSDLFISSYTTTLTALIRARRPSILRSDTEKKRFVVIGQAQSPGFSKIHGISTELANIQRYIKAVATLTRVEGREGRVSTIGDKLSESEWVHFAGQTIQDRQRPFESAFAVYDGLFTIQRIIQCNPQNPEFAYLSACQTVVGDQENLDEVIHLASAMQFAGFRSLVGTMGPVSDVYATKVASKFYEFMVDKWGHLDHTRAAWALWKTLRTVDIPIDQRILYIHLGA